jgi:hypothetical protein
VALEPLELTIRPGRTGGMGGAGSHTLHRSRLIRYPDAPRNRSTRGKPPRDGVGTGFSHTVEFSRNVAGLPFGDSLAVPASRPSPERRDGTTGLSRSSKTSHLHRSVLLVECRPPRRRRHTEAPPRTRTRLGVGTATEAVGSNPLGVRRPPVFRCRRRWRRPGEVLGREELPCLQPREGSTVRDGVSTRGRQQPQRFQRRGHARSPRRRTRCRYGHRRRQRSRRRDHSHRVRGAGWRSGWAPRRGLPTGAARASGSPGGRGWDRPTAWDGGGRRRDGQGRRGGRRRAARARGGRRRR